MTKLEKKILESFRDKPEDWKEVDPPPYTYRIRVWKHLPSGEILELFDLPTYNEGSLPSVNFGGAAFSNSLARKLIETDERRRRSKAEAERESAIAKIGKWFGIE